MAINFPTSPATNDLYTFGDRVWRYNGTAWELNSYTAAQGPTGPMGTAPNWVTKGTNYTASNGDRILTTGGITITLPANPVTGWLVQIADGSNWSDSPVTLARNGSTIETLDEDLTLNVDGVILEIVYNGSTWQVFATVGTGTAQITTLTSVQTLTNKTLTSPTLTNPIISGNTTETVYTITDGATVTISASNGAIQLWTLGGNRAPTFGSFDNGQSITLMINATSYIISWPTISWIGGLNPTLANPGITFISLWQVNNIIYGSLVGST